MNESSWVTVSEALAYTQVRFAKMKLSGPCRWTFYKWLRDNRIEADKHNKWKMWLVKLDAVDEAIMWKRIPPVKGRPPIAKRVETDEYIATQEKLL